ncbi:hypothetical protein ACS0TY_008899 [Phlomoides rotata]
MEEDQELKFVCKLCFKKYPCGKSLGGHMRSHVVSNPAESDDKFDSNTKKFSAFGGIGYSNDAKMGDFVNGQSSYGLRENPRKSWRAAADSNFPLPQERICKQCGKGFHSLKALCGHMACHSDKDRGFKDDHSWSTSENHKPLMDSHSDTEGEDRVVQTRSSKGKKVKKIVIKSPFSLASSVSEVDGEEQEEVAMCLMMLSRDSGNRGVNSVVESSDNNSVILETKSSSIDMKIAKRDALKHVEDQKNGELKLKGSVCNAEMENSDSGYFLDECAKAESDVSVDGFRDISKSYRMKENDDEYRIGGIGSRKRRYISDDSEMYKRNDPTANADSSQKRIKYECFNCKKSFKSYQALGGHRPCHKKSSAFYETTSRYETGENSLDDSAEFTTSKRKSDKKTKAKKNKGHACPFCHRVFKNGQALGGHKRSHFIGGHEVNNNPTTVTKPDLLDLNLPAPQDDGDDGNEQFSSW